MTAVLSWEVFPRIGGISPHGVGIALGFFLGGTLMARYAERKGISSDHVWNMLMRAVFGVIVGSRLFYVVGHLDVYSKAPLDIIKIWKGGLVFYGGVFGGIAAAYPYARKHGLKFWDVLDAAAPGFPLGLIIGRIGDLIVGDHLGGPTTSFLGWRPGGLGRTGALDPAHLPVSDPSWPLCLGRLAPQQFNPSLGCHQTALYDFMNVLVIFPIVVLLMRKERPRGFMIAFTATAYGIGRFFVDFARTGTATYAGLRGTQWISVALILFGIWYTVRRARSADFATYPEPVLEEIPTAESIYAQGEELPHPLAKDPAPEQPEFIEHPLAEEHPRPENPEHPLG